MCSGAEAAAKMANVALQQESSELSAGTLAEIAMAGEAFDDLAVEHHLYSFSDGEAISAG